MPSPTHTLLTLLVLTAINAAGCLDIESYDFSCTTDSDCLEGYECGPLQICVERAACDGVELVIQGEAGCFTPCSESQPCEAPEECQPTLGVCLADDDTAEGCLLDHQCDVGLVCGTGGECEQRPCDQCQGDQICVATSAGESCSAPECTPTLDCPDSLACVNGFCVDDTPPDDGCTATEGCADNEICDVQTQICIPPFNEFQSTDLFTDADIDEQRYAISTFPDGRPLVAFLDHDTSSDQTTIKVAEKLATGDWTFDDVAELTAQSIHQGRLELLIDADGHIHLATIETYSIDDVDLTRWTYLTREGDAWTERPVWTDEDIALRDFSLVIDATDTLHFVGFSGATDIDPNQVFHATFDLATKEWHRQSYTVDINATILGADFVLAPQGPLFSFIFYAEDTNSYSVFLGRINDQDIDTEPVWEDVFQVPHQLLVDPDGEAVILAVNNDSDELFLLRQDQDEDWYKTPMLSDWLVASARVQVNAHGRNFIAFTASPADDPFVGPQRLGFLRWNGQAYQTHIADDLTDAANWVDFALATNDHPHFVFYEADLNQIRYATAD